jgi:hypothetical protein
MAGTASRRVFGYLFAIAIAALPAVSQLLPAAASIGAGTLFGFTTSIVKLAPSTASVAPFADLPPNSNTQGFIGFANDSATHRIFIDRSVYTDQTVFPFLTADQIVTVDSRTGAGSVSQLLTRSLAGQGLVFDPASASLIGLTKDHVLVRVDATTGVETDLVPIAGDRFSAMAVAPAKHALYIASMSTATFPPTAVMLTVNTSTGAVSTSGALRTGVFSLAYDSSSGTLFGKTFCCPANLVAINPATGGETPVGTTDMGYGSNIVIDSSSHTVYVMEDVMGAFSFYQNLASINDQTGATSVAGPTNTFMYVGTLIFEGVATTPDSIKADVNSAAASGAIDNAGVATALIAQLDAAAAARANGQCTTAANIYSAFINAVTAQSGTHISAATAAQLVSEAQFLIANCP